MARSLDHAKTYKSDRYVVVKVTLHAEVTAHNPEGIAFSAIER